MAEEAIRSVILSAFPDHAIIGEETTNPSLIDPDTPGFVWVIDPIDGTRAFVCGRPTFATLISVVHNGAPVLGIIEQPITSERWLGVHGRQTTLNGKPVSVRSRASLSDCILQATTPEMFLGIDAVLFRRVSRRARNVVFGGDCYAYATLASGCGDLVVEADLKPWDFLALVPVVEGAGGTMCDWIGGPLGLWSDGRAIAACSSDVANDVVNVLDLAPNVGLSMHPMKVSEDLATPNASTLPDDPGPGHVESMTGYGRSVVERNGLCVTAQVRSVNSRYCEVQIRGAGILSAHEGELIAAVKRATVRGRVTATLDIDCNGERRKLRTSVDAGAVREASSMLREIANIADVDMPNVSDVMRFSEVLVRNDTEVDTTALLEVAREAVLQATGNMRAFRRREGAVLEEDLMKRTRKIADILSDIEQRVGMRVEQERARLTRLIDSILERDLSAARVEAEVTLFANRVDFTEEIVRMRSHLKLFELTFLGADDPIGQRLTFLLQEMNREVNTLSVKASDAPVSQLAVLVKEEIEKIREQCTNIR